MADTPMGYRTPVEAAAFMQRTYRDSRYTPRDRATDHAYANDPGPVRDYWLAVLAAIDGTAVVDSEAAR